MNVQGGLANKTDNRIVSYKHRTGRILVQLNSDACTIIPCPAIAEKLIWQVYVTNELKTKSFSFFTICAMVWVFIAMKNRYLNLSAVLKFAATQNKPKRTETK